MFYDTTINRPVHRRRPWIVAAVAVFFLIFWTLTHLPARHAAVAPGAPVVVAQALDRAMPLQLRAIGNVSPINSVQVKSRVDGHVVQIHFKEGDFVKKGTPLFTIDPRPEQASLIEAQADVLKAEAGVTQAQATIQRDRASLLQVQANKEKDVASARYAATEATRYKTLQKQGAVSLEQAQEMATNAKTSADTVKADDAVIQNTMATITADQASLKNAQSQVLSAKAALKNAHVQLGYTDIVSPIDGRTGIIQVLLGNIVRAEQDTLVSVNQIAPIDVLFSVPEDTLGQIRRYSSVGTVGAHAFGQKGNLLANGGSLIFLNNAVDPQTGTIQIKARFPNENNILWPQEFVNILLTLTVEPHRTIVPNSAVQNGQQGDFVWIVRPDNTAEMRAVQTAQSVKGWTVITSGVRPGERVVTDGQLQLSPGSKVSIKPKV